MSNHELPKSYDPSQVEPRWYRFWLEQDYFHAEAAAPKAPFSIVIPPPNVTGSLHMGHALGCTIQDVLIRWRRMQGANAMWLPGTDHAGISTQMVVEKDLRIREKKTRQEIGRESYMRVVAFDAPGAQGSQSRYRTLAANEDGALVELEPLTGRMHQLRVHMAHIGRPLIGDVRYGGALTVAGRAAPRLMLHAARLSFPHPDGGVKTVEAPAPADFADLLRAMSLA